VVVEEPARAQPTVDLAAQLAEIPFATGCREQDVAFYIWMAVDSGAHDLAQLLSRKAAYDLVNVLGVAASSRRHRAIVPSGPAWRCVVAELRSRGERVACEVRDRGRLTAEGVDMLCVRRHRCRLADDG
jgi:hypothetical protein